MTQGNRTFLFGILDGPVFTPSDAIVLGHEDVEGGLWASLWHAPLILSPLAILQTFWLDHPWWSFLSYDDLFTLGQLGLR
jgi:hypothetical protein